ncbi:hypothetical protein OG462_34440 [Streptomyces sp. NBC_01077]|nr:hypothetical protein OG462_34440 [Streptomyces sp. NBC_01077]
MARFYVDGLPVLAAVVMIIIVVMIFHLDLSARVDLKCRLGVQRG